MCSVMTTSEMGASVRMAPHSNLGQREVRDGERPWPAATPERFDLAGREGHQVAAHDADEDGDDPEEALEEDGRQDGDGQRHQRHREKYSGW